MLGAVTPLAIIRADIAAQVRGQSCRKRTMRVPAIMLGRIDVRGPIRLPAQSVSQASGARQPSGYVHVILKLGIEDELSRNERDA